jgi:hypothetical protein
MIKIKFGGKNGENPLDLIRFQTSNEASKISLSFPLFI